MGHLWGPLIDLSMELFIFLGRDDDDDDDDILETFLLFFSKNKHANNHKVGTINMSTILVELLTVLVFWFSFSAFRFQVDGIMDE